MPQKSDRVSTLSTDVDIDAQYVLDEYNSDEDSNAPKVGNDDLAQRGLSTASAALLEKYALMLLVYFHYHLRLTIYLGWE